MAMGNSRSKHHNNNGVNDDPNAVNDTDSVNEDASVNPAQNDVMNDDSDPTMMTHSLLPN